MQEDNLKELAAMFGDGHEITDNNGEVAEDTAFEESEPQEENEIEDAAKAEKPAESEEEAPQADDSEDETELAEGDDGKKYVPEKRFKKIYAKAKESERRIEELEEQLSTQPPSEPKKQVVAQDLETELLFMKMDMFDPNSKNYSRELDILAANIYKASDGTVTKIQAGRKALDLAKGLTVKENSIKESAKSKKVADSEGSIARRSPRVSTKVNPKNLSLEEMESYMKDNNMW